MSDLASSPPASLLGRAWRALRRLGPARFASLLAFNASLLISGRYGDYRYAYDRSFDRKYGVDTAGTIAVEELDAPDELRARANRYEVAEPAFFDFLVERLGLAHRADYLFIDVGSGKGRVMLLAALAGFRRVIGLEFATGLTQIARRNIAIFSRQHRHIEFTLVDGDATTFPFPPVPTVLFLNNPFDGQLIEKLLDSIERAHAGSTADVALLYMHSVHANLLRARDGWEEVDRGCFQNRRQFYAIFRRKGAARR